MCVRGQVEMAVAAAGLWVRRERQARHWGWAGGLGSKPFWGEVAGPVRSWMRD